MIDTSATRNLSSQGVRELQAKFVPQAFYQVTPIVVAEARGSVLYDAEGRRYVDFASGIGALNLGHGHPEILEVAHEQMAHATHLGFHVVAYEGYARLAEALDRVVPIAGPTKTVLVNSGAEAVENAIKIVRAATGRPYVIAFENAFHGRTYGAMTATGRTKPSRLPFMGSVLPGVIHLPYPYPYRPLADLPTEKLGAFYAGLVQRALDTQVAPEQVAAILAEPVQGEGGFVVPTPDFFGRLRDICDRHGILLISDEVQTGFGRTGRMFGIEHWGVTPDVVTMSKSLGAGWPLGAVTARAELMDALPAGSLGSTFGGHPVACAAALKMIEVIERDGIVAHTAELGGRIRTRFLEMAQRYPSIGEVRGLGAMIAMELVKDRATREPDQETVLAFGEEACERGLVTIRAGMYGNVIRTLVPLTMSHAELDEGLAILEEALRAALRRTRG